MCAFFWLTGWSVKSGRSPWFFQGAEWILASTLPATNMAPFAKETRLPGTLPHMCMGRRVNPILFSDPLKIIDSLPLAPWPFAMVMAHNLEFVCTLSPPVIPRKCLAKRLSISIGDGSLRHHSQGRFPTRVRFGPNIPSPMCFYYCYLFILFGGEGGALRISKSKTSEHCPCQRMSFDTWGKLT